MKAETRVKMEEYMAKHKGPHTVAALAKAMNADEKEVRRRMQHLVTGMVVVNTTPGKLPTLYQHAKHYKTQPKASGVVNRNDPIANGRMPNGSISYWRKHMARFNEAPRV